MRLFHNLGPQPKALPHFAKSETQINVSLAERMSLSAAAQLELSKVAPLVLTKPQHIQFADVNTEEGTVSKPSSETVL